MQQRDFKIGEFIFFNENMTLKLQWRLTKNHIISLFLCLCLPYMYVDIFICLNDVCRIFYISI